MFLLGQELYLHPRTEISGSMELYEFGISLRSSPDRARKKNLTIVVVGPDPIPYTSSKQTPFSVGVKTRSSASGSWAPRLRAADRYPYSRTR